MLKYVLTTAGNFGYAIAQWYLVWLFARSGGPMAVGQYSGLLAIATPIFIFASYGLGNVFLTLAKPYTVRTYVALSTAGQVIGTAALLVIGAAFGFPLDLVVAITLLKLADWAVGLAQLYLRSLNLIVATGAASVANAVLKVLLATLAIALSGSVAWGVIGSAVSSLVVLGAVVIVIIRELRMGPGSRTAPSPGGWKPILTAATPVMLGEFLVSLLTYVPVWVAQTANDPGAVGIYSGASYLVVAANLFGAAQQTVQLPQYREQEYREQESGDNRSRLLGKVRSESLRWGALGLAGAVVAVLAGPSVLRFVYGEGFDMPPLDIGILAIAAVLSVPNYLLETVMLVRNQYRAQTIVAVIAVAGTAVAGLLILPLTGALTAACVATLAGSLTRLLISWALVYRVGRR